MHILFTRPLVDCSDMMLKFKSLGHQVSHLPLLNIEKMKYDEINFSDYGGLIFTSANAVKYLDSKKLDIPLNSLAALLPLRYDTTSFTRGWDDSPKTELRISTFNFPFIFFD